MGWCCNASANDTKPSIETDQEAQIATYSSKSVVTQKTTPKKSSATPSRQELGKMTDKTKIIVSGVDHPAYVVVEHDKEYAEIRASFRVFVKPWDCRYILHKRSTARLVINTLRKCADEIERVMGVLPEG